MNAVHQVRRRSERAKAIQWDGTIAGAEPIAELVGSVFAITLSGLTRPQPGDYLVEADQRDDQRDDQLVLSIHHRHGEIFARKGQYVVVLGSGRSEVLSPSRFKERWERDFREDSARGSDPLWGDSVLKMERVAEKGFVNAARPSSMFGAKGESCKHNRTKEILPDSDGNTMVCELCGTRGIERLVRVRSNGQGGSTRVYEVDWRDPPEDEPAHVCLGPQVVLLPNGWAAERQRDGSWHFVSPQFPAGVKLGNGPNKAWRAAMSELLDHVAQLGPIGES